MKKPKKTKEKLIKEKVKVATIVWDDSCHYGNVYAANKRDFGTYRVLSSGLFLGENESKDSFLLASWYIPISPNECDCQAEVKRVEVIPKSLIRKMVVTEIEI